MEGRIANVDNYGTDLPQGAIAPGCPRSGRLVHTTESPQFKQGGMAMSGNVFISWSGNTSKAVAEALRDWLPSVIQAINPWMSAEDIDKGSRWSTEISGKLKEAKIGVICLTLDNLSAPWILFEAGALSKTVEDTFVCPYLFQLEPADVKGPLAQFQLTKADKEDTRKLLDTINNALGESALKGEQLKRVFEKWWPDLEGQLQAIEGARSEDAAPPRRTDRDILKEILSIVRGQARQFNDQEARQLIELEYKQQMSKQEALARYAALQAESRATITHLLEKMARLAAGEKEDGSEREEDNEKG